MPGSHPRDPIKLVGVGGYASVLKSPKIWNYCHSLQWKEKSCVIIEIKSQVRVILNKVTGRPSIQTVEFSEVP